MIVGQTANAEVAINVRAVMPQNHERKRRCTFFEPGEPPQPELLPDVEQRALAHVEPVLEHVVYFDLRSAMPPCHRH